MVDWDKIPAIQGLYLKDNKELSCDLKQENATMTQNRRHGYKLWIVSEETLRRW
jgi:hypothetical protein